MPKYQPFPDLPAAQFEAFKDDIAAHGVRYPIVVDEGDVTIDGHQRRRACAELKIECPRQVVEGLTEEEKHALAVALNAFRRHLTGVERAKAIQRLKALGWSNRRVADHIGTSEPTVRRALAAGASHDAPAPPMNVDRETGEIIDDSDAKPPPTTASPRSGPAADPEPTRVVGRDGKSYPSSAAKPAVDDAEAAAQRLRLRLGRNMDQLRHGLLAMDPDDVAAAIGASAIVESQWHLLTETQGLVVDWFARVVAARPRPFTVVEGGRS